MSARPARAYVALGSNLHEPEHQVRAGAEALARLPKTQRDCCSSLYRTAPVGFTEQPNFINAVCALTTHLGAMELMQSLLEIEHVHGRRRDDVPSGGPRTLDLDLLLYDDVHIRGAALTLPHPRLHERAFVLFPLAEIAPDLRIPGHGPVRELLARVQDQAIERLQVRAA